MTIIRFISDRPQRYGVNNFQLLEFSPGEFYDVPPAVAQGMIKRKWAQLASADDLAQAADRTPPTPDPTPGDAAEKERMARERAAKEQAEADALAAAQRRLEEEAQAEARRIAAAEDLERRAAEEGAVKGRRRKETSR